MKQTIIVILALVLNVNLGYSQFGKLLDKAKSSASELTKIGKSDGEIDIAAGLKEALNNGVTDAVESLSATDGYLASAYKILLPEEANKVISKVKRLPGMGDVEQKIINQINKAAELSAKEAAPIFVDAIKGMTVSDGKKILFGEDNAATTYLDDQTRSNLYSAFLPIIKSSLEKVNATKYWSDVVNQYNKIPLTKDLNPDLDDHVNNKALDGLFGLIQVKEKSIRNNIDQRTSPLLKDVFGLLEK